MTALTQIQPKTAIDSLPRIGQAQTATPTSAVSALPRSADDMVPTGTSKIESLARDLVGQTFFGTLLKQMHESPFKSEIFSGGRGEKAFSPMHDQIIAQRLAAGAGQKLVRPIVKKFQKQAEAAYNKQKEQGFVASNRRA